MIKHILITGGTGFIGSNLVAALLEDDRVGVVRVLDNLSTGFEKNVEEFYDNENFEFIKGDIRDYNTCLVACKGMDLISHQAALGSVPRSIKDPLTTNAVNIGGTLNIFRVVFAASSSTYGDSKELPKVEEKIGAPLSPYAVTKYVNEVYAQVFAETYNFNYIGLRYFNVFGPKQDPHGAYAAVIPLFIKAAMSNDFPTINGDGSYSRDFTYVDNAIQANKLALFATEPKALNQIYNVACGTRTSLNELWDYIKAAADIDISAQYGPNRAGDIPHSLADVSKAQAFLNYQPKVNVKEGLTRAFNWYQNNNR